MVCNTGGSNAESVAELAWGLILGVSRRIPGGDRLMREGKWERFMPQNHKLVWGKTLGVIGFGSIGRRVGKIGRLAFNMDLLVSDPFLIPETIRNIWWASCVPKDGDGGVGCDFSARSTLPCHATSHWLKGAEDDEAYCHNRQHRSGSGDR